MVKPMEEKGFQRLGNLVETTERCSLTMTGDLSARLSAPQGVHDTANWTVDSNWAFEEQHPLKGRKLIYMMAFTLLVLLLWAGVAPMDEVVRGTGKAVAPSGIQAVQSVDGGVVKEILVKEAQKVEKGAVLLRVDPVRFDSMLGQQQARVLSLRARVTRLEALSSGEPFNLSPELIRKIPEIAESERQLYQTSLEELESHLRVGREQVHQRRQELLEAQARYSQATHARDLVLQELEMTRPLLQSGAVPKVEVMRLEKSLAQAKGERNQVGAQMSRIRSSIQEGQEQLEELELRATSLWRRQLSDTLGELESLREGSKALSDRIVHSEIRAPISGIVKRLAVNTAGGVIMPGGLVAEIVPEEETLFVEAQLSPKDRAFLRPGQEAVVKFTAYEYAIYGGVKGIIDSITPDTITDSRGLTYYRGRIRIEKSAFGADLPILPGMMAQVDVKTGTRTILSYLLKPLLRAKAGALRER